MLKKAFYLSTVALLSAAAFAQQPAAPAIPGNSPTRAAEPAFKAKKLTRAEFDALLAHPEHILLIDVRRPDEIAAIGGFPVYLNIQAKDLKNHLNEIPKDRLIVTVSNHAARAGVAADLLAENGFQVAGAASAQTYETEGEKLVKFAPIKPDSH
jgi:rhodanese-related sulfurtransferase